MTGPRTLDDLLVESRFSVNRDPLVYADAPVPTERTWLGLWQLWDLVTRSMIPNDALLEKPIHLRNCCIFYFGHIPAFLDRHLGHGTNGSLTEPAHFATLFERGIDPDVDNPELCHDHSEIPDEWPSLQTILEYQEQVRARLTNLYESGQVQENRRLGRRLWLGSEHEIMHLETLLYMLLQSDWVLPPPGRVPDFEGLAAAAQKRGNALSWATIPHSTLTLGLHDPENDEGPERFFGWDNEKPQRTVDVPAFQASNRAITNGEYAQYLDQCNSREWPASWAVRGQDPSELSGRGLNIATGNANGHVNGYTHSNGNGTFNGRSPNGAVDEIAHGICNSTSLAAGKAVRTVYGLVPLEYAWDWPVMASYDELAGCAQWMGGRIPTHEEANSIYEYVEGLERNAARSGKNARTIPAVNGHLSNDGVEETPPAPRSKAKVDPRSLFADLTDCNVGFRAFHPLPANLLGKNPSQPAGRAGLGGVWEWTSTELTRHEGFQPMEAYPAYTADFFDGKHNIVLGGSWATHPRIAGRKSFVNWYQRNYPYAWCGARVVRDLVPK